MSCHKAQDWHDTQSSADNNRSAKPKSLFAQGVAKKFDASQAKPADKTSDSPF
ncbi:hypothetical protein IMZ48_26005 [Candidatus Bathyarchaeota archaeon]|nr:hypothetical protein [Candidatus Bathyarchaeota archaeon]